jgi:glucosamine--fructose-6-phosphate aminotransferase (isomerizing)
VCGIIGYCGLSQAAPLLIKGLKRLEYRGYDSYGIAVQNRYIEINKRQGKISDGVRDAGSMRGNIGIGHTRWATHGVPNDQNAHPHTDCRGNIAIVHNGIIENYTEIRRELVERGHIFHSDTDSEVISHLIEEHYTGDLMSAMENILPLLEGSYAILAIARGEKRIVAARQSSPLVIGMGDQELFAASDMTPILEYTERAVFLEDGDIVSLAPDGIVIRNAGKVVIRPTELIDWSFEDVKKGGFRHYMLKEIYEQPGVFSNTLRAQKREEMPKWLRKVRRISIIACGTSYHSGLLFKYLAEEICRIPARLEFASEFKYYPPPVDELVIGITQSGETADTIAGIKVAKSFNCPTLAVTNVLGSSITRIADHTIYMQAGPEISVAATKSFIAQLAVLMHIVDEFSGGTLTESLERANRAIEETLLVDIGKAVKCCQKAQHIFFVGRGPLYPVALEGALKMKEISYIHAEGYAAGEIKHGPFALLSEETPVIAICTPGQTYNVMISNIKEMKARGAPMVILGEDGDRDLEEIADVFISLPSHDLVTRILAGTVALQLLAYYTAETLGRDIDKPRNLAKSVTVE